MAGRQTVSLIWCNVHKILLTGLRRNMRRIIHTTKYVAAGGSVGLLSTSLMTVQASTDDFSDVTVADFMCQPITDFQKLGTSNQMMHKMEILCMKLQGDLCKEMERIEGSTKFRVDRWLKSEQLSGGGVTCVMEDGAVFERAGVNISVVSGHLTPAAVKAMNSRGRELPEDEKLKFAAVGISSVIHPRNPMCPTVHFNYRYFEVEPESGGEKQWWFGGGSDLTPYYLFEKDAQHFHCTYKQACDQHGPTYYSRFKKWCDDYFNIPHRCMRRGVGGIFFDDFNAISPDASFSFVKSCAAAVMPSYLPIIQRRKNEPYGVREREWQLLRRGNYVEFNLLYDRGTKFGFSTPGARHESILVSMPPRASWKYDYLPEPGSAEAKLVNVLKDPREWVTRGD